MSTELTNRVLLEHLSICVFDYLDCRRSVAYWELQAARTDITYDVASELARVKHQLQESISYLTTASEAIDAADGILTHCDGNPFSWSEAIHNQLSSSEGLGE